MEYDTLLLKCGDGLLSIFMPELQRGFYIRSYEGETVHSFLVDACCMDEDYIAEKIKTILINGGPVDDIFNTGLVGGTTCAVSGAMPGIAGAMMRMGSPYAPMRESITVKPSGSPESEKEILVTLKLFNVVMHDLGPDFLKNGILVDKERVLELFSSHGEEISSGCRAILFNNVPLDPRILAGGGPAGISELVKLKVETEYENNS